MSDVDVSDLRAMARWMWDIEHATEALLVPFRPHSRPTPQNWMEHVAYSRARALINEAVVDAELDSSVEDAISAWRYRTDDPFTLMNTLARYKRRGLIRFGSGGTLLHVVPPPGSRPWGQPLYRQTYDAVWNSRLRERRRRENSTRIDRIAAGASATVETVLLTVALPEVIAEANSGSVLGRFGPARFIAARVETVEIARGVEVEFVSGFLERGVFGAAERRMFAVRAGEGGRFFDLLFESEAEALDYARARAALGRGVIRADSALPVRWRDGIPGNPVDGMYVYAIPPGTRYIQGVAAPIRGASGVLQPGGGPQVVIDNLARPRWLHTVPVTLP